MIDFSQAIKIARQAALDVLGATSTSVEEVERHVYRKRDVWAITLGVPRDVSNLSAVARLTASPVEYKRFLVDAETGDFLAMKLREPVFA
jgi:hypothetical protein